MQTISNVCKSQLYFYKNKRESRQRSDISRGCLKFFKLKFGQFKAN